MAMLLLCMCVCTRIVSLPGDKKKFCFAQWGKIRIFFVKFSDHRSRYPTADNLAFLRAVEITVTQNNLDILLNAAWRVAAR